jgi:putative spermidine/putrescine transport system substrate-binding protein
MTSYRRILLFAVLLAVVAGATLALFAYFGRTSDFRAVAWGGSTQDALRSTMFAPFGKESGGSVSEDTYDGSLARIQAAARPAQGDWDVVEVETAVLLSGASQNLYRPVTLPDAVLVRLDPSSRNAHGIGLFEWWTVLAWNKKRLPTGVAPPTSWGDFWNLQKYPGPRGMRNSPRAALEIALIADGVSPQSLYPLDVPRALKKLDQIKKSIVWWSTGSEEQERLLSEYTMTTAWSGRVWTQITAGEPVDMTTRQGIADRDWWIIMNNSAHVDRADAFLEYSTRKDVQARFANATGYGPVNPDAYPLLTDQAKKYIPNPRASDGRPIDFNATWWAEHEPEILNQWNVWLSKPQ